MAEGGLLGVVNALRDQGMAAQCQDDERLAGTEAAALADS
jgi:hypothetical protein